MFEKQKYKVVIFYQTNKHEIINIVERSKSKSSEDVDGISMILIKKIIVQIVQPLVHIFNLSLKNRIFPGMGFFSGFIQSSVFYTFV